MNETKETIGGLHLGIVIQGFEITRADFGGVSNHISTVRDRIAFEIAFTMNVGCGDKKALMSLLYNAADSIIAATNREKAIWTRIADTKPSPFLAGVLFRWKPDGPDKPWCVDLARPNLPADDIDNVRWLCISSLTEPLWPKESEWMAIPL